MPSVVRQVVNPSESEIDRIVWAIHEAFNRSFFIGTCGGDDTLCVDLVKVHVIKGLLKGEVYVSETEDGEIAGAAVWFGPGSAFADTKEAEDECGWTALMARLPEQGREAWRKFLDDYKIFSEDAYGPGVKRASYHLQLFGTDPKYRKQGHGRKLVDFVLEKAKKEGVRACVETSRQNALPIYKALGFDQVEKTIAFNLGEQSTLWALITPL